MTTHRDPRIIVALDLPSESACLDIVERTRDSVSTYKIGLRAIIAGYGIQLVHMLKGLDLGVMLDVKALDIGNTVQDACKEAAQHGVDFVTVHAYPKALEAAMGGVDSTYTQVLAVTCLTDHDQDALCAAGYHMATQSVSPELLVARRVSTAVTQGLAHGFVCSAREVKHVRSLAPNHLLVVPGVRMEGGDAHDQVRTGTPQQAIRDGADRLVIGRPIIRADDPARAASDYAASIRNLP